MHRVKGGWVLVGETAPTVPDLGKVLKALRDRAAALERGGVTTKLILPNDQILYTALPLATSDPETRRAEIEAALVGLTPYALPDLAYDYRVRDDQTAQVAAIARETLAEAESFAVIHGFNPVSFVAVPEDGSYGGEPWFGTTKAAANLLPATETVERDRFPARISPPKPEPTPRAAPQEISVTPLEPPQTRPSFASQRAHGGDAPKAAPPKSGDHRITLTPPPVVVTSAITAPPGAEDQPPESLTTVGTRLAAVRTAGLPARPALIAAPLAVLGLLTVWLMLPGDDAPAPDTAPVAEVVAEAPPLPAPLEVAPPPLEDEAEPEPETGFSETEAQEVLADLGIWPLPPQAPAEPGESTLDGFYIASIDHNIPGEDAVALPPAEALLEDYPLHTQMAPPPPGTTFDLNERGLVTPSRAGTLSPEGVMVFAGPPPRVPPLRPREEAVTDPIAAAQKDDPLRARLARFRAKPRPTDLAERLERSQRGGLTEAELAAIRPRPRPESAQQVALAIAEATAAVPVTAEPLLIPKSRPSGFEAAIASAVKEANAVPAPAAVTPARTQIPSSASVAKQATLDNAVNLSKVNLFGVFGAPGDRRALVRLSSGRYVKVEVGDRLDGGKVVAIGDDDLSYVKNGKTIKLEMPRG
ncbi:hypothetical protein OE856_05390 [Actibacterium sp. XHP0104]|nr:hypothetical protein [Actibacterium sp. XHP0104]